MSGIVVLILRILLALVLYGFLGWCLYILWRDLNQQSTLLSRRRLPKIQLEWQVDGTREMREFDTPQVRIGRDPAAECPVLDETISAHHARLTYHHNQWWVEDLHSTNGTFLNDERLDMPTVVASGDEVRCGQVSLMVNIRENTWRGQR